MENEATTKTPIPTRSGFRNVALCTSILAFSTYLSCHEFIATEPAFLSMDYFSVFSAFSVAISFVPLCLGGQDPRSTLVERALQIAPFLQNKANFTMGNINISTAKTKAYAKEQRTMNNERYSKQTQSKPISNAETAYSAYQTRDSHVASLLAMTGGERTPAARSEGAGKDGGGCAGRRS